MKVEIVTANEAKRLGLTHSRLLKEGHGAFGEPDNSYEDIIMIGGKIETLSDNDLVVFYGESPNRKVIQIINKWNCSDSLLEIFNPHLLLDRKEERYKTYLELKKEFK